MLCKYHMTSFLNYQLINYAYYLKLAQSLLCFSKNKINFKRSKTVTQNLHGHKVILKLGIV